MKTDFIWFDIGYTLLYVEREKRYKKLLSELKHNRSIEEIKEGFHLADKTFMREYSGLLGKNRASYMPWYIGVLNYNLNVKLDLCKISAIWTAKSTTPYVNWIPYNDVSDVLSKLKKRNFRIGIISNWDSSAFSLLKKNNLEKYFDTVIISSEIGYEKPDDRIFKIAMEKAGVKPNQCIYVGDNYYDDTIGCRKVGMKCLIINRFGKQGVEEITDQIFINNLSEIFSFI